MTTQNRQLLNEAEKIHILLHEYNALRQEIHNRTSCGFQLVSVGAVLFVLITNLTSLGSGFRLWCSIAASTFTLVYAGCLIYRDINKAAERLRALEQDINNRSGEKLLIWATRFGGAKTGYLGRAKPLEEKATEQGGKPA